MKKKLAVLLLAALPAWALAANGPADGIYSCAASAAGQVASGYVTMNGQPDGMTIYAVVALYSNQPLQGFGIGVVANQMFIGTTSSGGTFSFLVTPIGMHGTLGAYVGGTFVNASVNCIKVW